MMYGRNTVKTGENFDLDTSSLGLGLEAQVLLTSLVQMREDCFKRWERSMRTDKHQC